MQVVFVVAVVMKLLVVVGFFFCSTFMKVLWKRCDNFYLNL